MELATNDTRFQRYKEEMREITRKRITLYDEMLLCDIIKRAYAAGAKDAEEKKAKK